MNRLRVLSGFTSGLKSTGSCLVLGIFIVLGITLAAPEAGLCESPGYSQQGAFRVKSNAENMLHELEASGRVAFMLEKIVKGKPLYIVMAHDTRKATAQAPAQTAAPQRVVAAKVARNAPEPEAAPSNYHSSSAHMLRNFEKKSPDTDSSGRIIIRPLNKRTTQALLLSPLVEVHTSPEDGAEVLGKAYELGTLWYVKSSGNWHSLWLSDSRYGYVKETEAALVSIDGLESQRASATGAGTISN